MMNRRELLLALSAVLATTGCFWKKNVPETQANLTNAPVHSSSEPLPIPKLGVLLDRPVLENVERQFVFDSQRHESYSMPTIANDGEALTLIIDRESGLAWVQSDGGIGDHLHRTCGPWKSDDPVVERIVADFKRRDAMMQERSKPKRLSPR